MGSPLIGDIMSLLQAPMSEENHEGTSVKVLLEDTVWFYRATVILLHSV